MKSEPRMRGENIDTGKGIMGVRPKIGMRGRNGKINGWGIPLCAENKRSQQTERYPWESMGASSLCNSINP
mgnify:CR=1 FL=1